MHATGVSVTHAYSCNAAQTLLCVSHILLPQMLDNSNYCIEQELSSADMTTHHDGLPTCRSKKVASRPADRAATHTAGTHGMSVHRRVPPLKSAAAVAATCADDCWHATVCLLRPLLSMTCLHFPRNKKCAQSACAARNENTEHSRKHKAMQT